MNRIFDKMFVVDVVRFEEKAIASYYVLAPDRLFNLPQKTFREPSAEPSAKTFCGTVGLRSAELGKINF